MTDRYRKIEKTIDAFAKYAFGRSQTEARAKKVCVICGEQISLDSFRDDLSRKECGISGMCQECQDKTFA